MTRRFAAYRTASVVADSAGNAAGLPYRSRGPAPAVVTQTARQTAVAATHRRRRRPRGAPGIRMGVSWLDRGQALPGEVTLSEGPRRNAPARPLTAYVTRSTSSSAGESPASRR